MARNILAKLLLATSIAFSAACAQGNVVILPRGGLGPMHPVPPSKQAHGMGIMSPSGSNITISVSESKKEKEESDVTELLNFPEKSYKWHLQGLCVGDGAIYWSVTFAIVKTDVKGKILAEISVPWHHGDCCFAFGKLYVAVNHGEFNTDDKADSWIYAYDANLKFLGKLAVPEMTGGAGGIEFSNGKFYVIGGAPEGKKVGVCVYSEDFKFIKKIEMEPSDTYLGLQTISRNGDGFIVGCYRKKAAPYSIFVDSNFNIIGSCSANGAFGIAALPPALDGTPRFPLASPGRGKLPNTFTFSAKPMHLRDGNLVR